MDDAASWEPVQEIVRLNFKALHDVVKAHGEAIKSVEKQMSSKVGRPEHAAALTEKVSVSELTTTFEELSRVIDDKADARDTSALVDRMAGRAEVQAALSAKADVEEVQRCLDAKASASEVHHKLSQLDERAGSIEERLVDGLASKASVEQVDVLTAAKCSPEDVKALIHEAVEKLRDELRAEIAAGLEPKASKTSVAAALKTKAARADVETLLVQHSEQLHAALAKKADVEAVSTALAAKASRVELNETVDSKLEAARAAIDASIALAATKAEVRDRARSGPAPLAPHPALSHPTRIRRCARRAEHTARCHRARSAWAGANPLNRSRASGECHQV